jgi:hypothetical protein
VSFATVNLCVASQRMSIVVYFVIDSVRKLLDNPTYITTCLCVIQENNAQVKNTVKCRDML